MRRKVTRRENVSSGFATPSPPPRGATRVALSSVESLAEPCVLVMILRADGGDDNCRCFRFRRLDGNVEHVDVDADVDGEGSEPANVNSKHRTDRVSVSCNTLSESSFICNSR